jgi:hypothetical protein
VNDFIDLLFLCSYLAICLGVTMAFWLSNQKVNIVERILISAHGAIIVILLGTSYLISLFKLSSFDYLSIYSALCTLPIISAIICIFRHKGQKSLLILLIPLLPALIGTFFLGGMYVTGDSL